MKKQQVSISIPERDLCRHFGISRVVTARWIGTKGNRKMVIYGEK